MAWRDQVVDGQARGERAAAQAGVFEHGAPLHDPVFARSPFQVAEQAPGGVVERAVEIGLRVGPVVTVVDPADQAQVVGQAQRILQFQIIAVFPGALVDVAAHRACGAIAQLGDDLASQRLLLLCARWHTGADVAGQAFGVVGVELPEAGQLGAEGDFRVAGAPGLLAVPLLRRTLQVEAVLGIEVDVPAHGGGEVVGLDIGIVAGCGNTWKHWLIRIGPLVAAFLGGQLPIDAVLGRQ
ncbi:hypothetical protein D3C76_949640 [compost metagenome]